MLRRAAHPWVRPHLGSRQDLSVHPSAGGPRSTVPLDVAALVRIKDFAAYGKVKRLAMKKFAKSFNDVHMLALHDQFSALDTAGHGELSYEDVSKALRKARRAGR